MVDTKHWGLESGIGSSLSERPSSLFLVSCDQEHLKSKAGGHGEARGTQARDKEGLSEPLGIAVPRFHLPQASIKNKMPSMCGWADSGLSNC